MILSLLLKLPETLLAGALGCFRGGQVLPTGSTFLTRLSWAVLMGLLAYVNGYTPITTGVLILGLWLTMWFISHVPYQNMNNFSDYEGMLMVGLERGAFIAILLEYFMHSAIWFMPLYGAIELAAYAIGKVWPWKNIDLFSQGTSIAENLQSAFLFLVILAVPHLPVI